MTKGALITGITGQDGSYLTELLLEKGHEVYRIVRRSSSFNTERIDHLYQDPHESNTRLRMFYGDLNDPSSLNRILRRTEPDEIYNLGHSRTCESALMFRSTPARSPDSEPSVF